MSGGCACSASRLAPISRAPVPQSMTRQVPASARTSTQEVLPPNRAVRGPGVGTEPRVPQNRIFIGCALEPDGLRDLVIVRRFVGFIRTKRPGVNIPAV